MYIIKNKLIKDDRQSSFLRGKRSFFHITATLAVMVGLIVSFLVDVKPTIAAVVDFSGVAYSGEGTGPIDGTSVNKTVAVLVNGVSAASDDITDATGTWAVTGVTVNLGDVITVFLDNETERATTVFVANATNQTNVDLYQNRVIVRSDTGTIVTSDLVVGDNGDADIRYTVVGSALAVDSGFEFHVWTGDTFSAEGTVSTSGGGSIHIDTGATFAAGGNVTVNGSWTNSGTFTHNSFRVTFNSTSSGRTISGTLNGSSAFNKLTFNGNGGAWTITDPILIDAANATDTVLVNNGTVTLGDGNGDNMEIRGAMDIAPTGGNNAVFQTAALAEGSTITLDVNQNSSTPSCANCYIRIGNSGTGQFLVRKNTIVRLNPRSTATASDTYIRVAAGGYLEIQGSQDATGTVTATDSDALLETTLCSTNSFTNDQHNNKKVRMTSGLAYGRTFAVADTIADDTNCATNTDDSVTRTATDSTDSTISSITTVGPLRRICAAGNAVITANDQGVGRYLRNQTDDTYFLIADSVNNDSTNCSGNDSFVILNNPDSYTGLATSETIDISDGVRPADTFEVLDYAHVTAENGTTCNATINQSGEAYIQSNADSETLIRYAELCNLGRSAGSDEGLYVAAVNETDASEGFKMEKSEFHHSYAYRPDNLQNSTVANSGGTTDNNFYNNVTILMGNGSLTNDQFSGNRVFSHTSDGIGIWGANHTVTNNYFYSNGGEGMETNSGATTGTYTGNTTYLNTSDGFAINSHGNTISSNIGLSDGSEELQIFSHNNTISSNTFYNTVARAIVMASAANNNVLTSNTVMGMAAIPTIDIQSGSENNVVKSNTIYNEGGSGAAGIAVRESENIIQSNTIFSNGNPVTHIGIWFVNTANKTNIITADNDIYNEFYGLHPQGSSSTTTALSIRDRLGTLGANAADIAQGSSDAHKLTLLGTDITAATPVASVTTTGAYVMAKKYDTNNGQTRVWGEYTTVTDNAETPQNESSEKYNYANNLWEDSITPHHYNVGMGGGSEDTNLSFSFSSGSLGGDSNLYTYRVICTAANCVSTGSSWDVYRNGTLLTLKASTATQYTDSQADGGSAPGVRFTIDDAGTDYSTGATYAFVAYRGSGDANTQKTLKLMQDGDVFTAAASTTLELKGQSAGTNVTQMTRDTSGGYQFVVNGTIDANAYSFSHLGGTGQASALDINTGATVTSLSNGAFDNFAVNNGSSDAFIDVASSVIGSGTPSLSITGTTFANTGSNANCNVNATGSDATGYWYFRGLTGSTGAFGTESNDCNDGAADANPGQIAWPDSGINLSGVAYTNEGTTPLSGVSPNKTVAVSVNGTRDDTAEITTSGGAWSVTGVMAFSGDRVAVYLDDETEEATTIFVSDGTTQTNVDLYQNRTIVRADTGSITNANLSTADDADDDVKYNVSGSNATVDSGFELHVWTGDTYAPGGTVATQSAGLHITSGATLNAAGNAISVGGPWTNAGTFTSGSNTVTFSAASGTHAINSTGATTDDFFNVILNDSGGSATYQLSSAFDVDNNLTITGGTLDANGQTINIAGSYDNNDIFTPGVGTVIFDAGATGKTIEAGSSNFYAVQFNNAAGGWTIQTDDMTVTNDLTLTNAASFTVASGRILEVRGNFSHAVAGANTTWTGSTLYLNGTGILYDINSRTHGGDTFGTLRVGASDQVASWDVGASSFTVDSGGCLYSQDHTGVAGQLNIYGSCNSRSNEYWSYATDFDGTSLGGSSRQVSVRFAAAGAFTVDAGDTLAIIGQSAGANRTAITRQSSGNYGVTVAGTINAQFYDFDYLTAAGLNIASTATVTELANGSFDNIASGASAAYITATGITSTDSFASMLFDSNSDGIDANVVYNVNADGSGISWTFTSASGNRVGEAYDREVNGASLVWSSVFTAMNDSLGSDTDVTNSTSTLSANWTTSSDVGVDHFEYAIGITPGGTSIVSFTSTGMSKNFTNGSLTLSNGQTYYSTARAMNSANEPMDFITADGILIDTDAPVFSSIVASATTTSITVTWTSNEPATSQIEYGLTAGYGSQTTEDTSLVTSHGQTILGLTPGTLYHFRILGDDAATNAGMSTDQTITTDSPNATVITNVQVTQITTTSVQVTWTTNHAADSKVRYGTTTAYGGEVYEGALVTSHVISITGLTPNTIYHYEVLSAGNTTAIDADATFTTAGGIPVPTIVSPTVGQWLIDTTPTITGLAKSGNTVKLYFDGTLAGTVTATTHTSGTGNFAFTPTTAVSLGAHTLAVEASNSEGDSSRRSDGFTFYVGLPTIGPTILAVVHGSAIANGVGWGDTDVKVYANGQEIGEFYIGGVGVRSFSYRLPITVDGRYAVTMKAFDNRDKPSRLSNTVYYTHQHDTVVYEVPISNAGTYTVKQNDSLWKIAAEVYGDGRQYGRIVSANAFNFPSLLFNPSVLRAGWILKIP